MCLWRLKKNTVQGLLWLGRFNFLGGSSPLKKKKFDVYYTYIFTFLLFYLYNMFYDAKLVVAWNAAQGLLCGWVSSTADVVQ